MSTPPNDAPPSSSAEHDGPAAPSHRITALRGDGSQYQGDLLKDIVRYRQLRALSLGGGTFTDEQRSILQSLEARVRQPAGNDNDEQSALRSFYRFRCDFTAELRQEDSDARSAINVADISAGGVKIVGTNAQSLGDTVVIRFHRGSDDPIEFTARVAWARDIEYGIMFAGAANATAD